MELWSPKKIIVVLFILVNSCYAADANEQEPTSLIARLVKQRNVKMTPKLYSDLAADCKRLAQNMVHLMQIEQDEFVTVRPEIRDRVRGVSREEAEKIWPSYYLLEIVCIEQARQKIDREVYELPVDVSENKLN